MCHYAYLSKRVCRMSRKRRLKTECFNTFYFSPFKYGILEPIACIMMFEYLQFVLNLGNLIQFVKTVDDGCDDDGDRPNGFKNAKYHMIQATVK